MSNPNQITLHLDNPCNADWNSMTITPNGKHCGHCAKTVFDATGLNAEEIFNILKEQKGNACMRIRSEVLDAPFFMAPPPWYAMFHRFYKRAALFIGLQFLFFNQIKAQLVKVIVNDKSSDAVAKKYLKSVKITGTVADSASKAPIPYVKVMVRKNDKIIATTTCKFDGTYVLDMKDTIEDNAPASIEFLQTMFDTATIKEFIFHKPLITIDTVYLNKSFSLLKEIDIIADKQSRYRESATSIGGVSYRRGCGYSNHIYTPIATLSELSKLLRNVDPTPRPSRIDIDGAGRDLLK